MTPEELIAQLHFWMRWASPNRKSIFGDAIGCVRSMAKEIAIAQNKISRLEKFIEGRRAKPQPPMHPNQAPNWGVSDEEEA